eukprot:RCo041210
MRGFWTWLCSAVLCVLLALPVTEADSSTVALRGPRPCDCGDALRAAASLCVLECGWSSGHPAVNLSEAKARAAALNPVHIEHVKEVQQMGARAKLVVIGDSLVHILDNGCWPGSNCEEIKKITNLFRSIFNPNETLTLGMCGDQTQDVQWRLSHGELEGLAPEHAVLLVGANNFLLSDMPWQDAAVGVSAVLELLLRKLPRTQVVVLGVLPQRPATHNFAIAELNEFLGNTAVAYGQLARLHFVSCGQLFVEGDKAHQRAMTMDGIHPSLLGYNEMLRRCWVPALRPGSARVASATAP